MIYITSMPGHHRHSSGVRDRAGDPRVGTIQDHDRKKPITLRDVPDAQ